MPRAQGLLSPPRMIPVLLLSLLVCLWQLSFFLDPKRLPWDYQEGTALGMCTDVEVFFLFFYHFDQLPVGVIDAVPPPEPFDAETARELVRASGHRLRNEFAEPCNTARYGDLGKVFLFFPAALARGSPTPITVVPATASLFVAGLLCVLVGFWRAGYAALGVLIVLLAGSNPFQLFEVYRRENVFSLPISTALIVLGTHVRWMADRGRIDGWAWLTAALTGAFLASVHEMRANSALMALAVPGIYLTIGGSPWRRRLALVAVFAASLALTAQIWQAYFEAKHAEARDFVRSLGGQPYTGPRTQHHPLWHNLYLGLGDFDTEKGYAWDDRLAYAYAAPILRSRYGLDYTYSGDYYFEESYDGAGAYPISPQDLPEYIEIIRQKVFDDVLGDPGWYLGILWQRIRAIMSQTTPVGMMIGNLWVGIPFSGWFVVPTVIGVVAARKAFLAKLLVFSFPLSLTALLIYCGPGATHYAIFHILTLGVWLQLLLEALRRRRAARSPAGELIQPDP
jgi:hypothetical protein